MKNVMRFETLVCAALAVLTATMVATLVNASFSVSVVA
jgi:hypothetical protein